MNKPAVADATVLDKATLAEVPVETAILPAVAVDNAPPRVNKSAGTIKPGDVVVAALTSV